MRIRYNISRNKKIDYGKSLFSTLLLLIVSALFLALGINNLSVKDKQLQQDKQKLDFYNSKLDEMVEKSHQYNKEIKRVSNRWRNKVRFSNALISMKAYNFIARLNVIEDLLPYGVYIKDIAIKADAKSHIRLTIVANSYANLFQAYKKFSKFEPAIHKETETDGVHQARLSINLKLPKEPGKDEKR